MKVMKLLLIQKRENIFLALKKIYLFKNRPPRRFFVFCLPPPFPRRGIEGEVVSLPHHILTKHTLLFEGKILEKNVSVIHISDVDSEVARFQYHEVSAFLVSNGTSH